MIVPHSGAFGGGEVDGALGGGDTGAGTKGSGKEGGGRGGGDGGRRGGGGGAAEGGEGADEIDVDVLGGWSPSPTWAEVETGACRARWQCMRETVASVTQTVRVKAKSMGTSDPKVSG